LGGSAGASPSRFQAGGLPDGHALEMGAVGVGIADTLDDRQAAGLEQPGGISHRGVEADMVVDLEKLIGRQAKRFAMAGITLVRERDDSVDAVVAAVELDDNEHSA